jgi:hypothetical protein
MPVRFPVRMPDGSFVVLASIRGVVATEDAVRAWIANWAGNNAVWRRTWTTQGGERVDVLNLHDEFSEPPSFDRLDGGELHVRFRGLPEAKMWKDWLAKFTQDFLAAHPGTALIRYASI